MSLRGEDIDKINCTRYNVNGGDDVKAMNIINAALKECGRTQKSLAAELGLSPQNFNKKLVTNTITAKEFFDAVEAIGLVISFRNKDTGEEVKERKSGILPRVTTVIDGVRYDTFKSDALCHCEVADGWVAELYAFKGAYFIVISTNWTNAKPLITPCEKEDAMKFYDVNRDENSEPTNVVFGE